MKRMLKSARVLGIIDRAGQANGPAHCAELNLLLAGAVAACSVVNGASDPLRKP